MPITRTAVLGLGVTVGSMLLAHAAGPSLDVKTGLWEITSTGATTGAPPIPPEALAGVKNAFVKQVPLGRMGGAEEVARWVLAIADPSATWVTGQILSVDGGMSLT